MKRIVFFGVTIGVTWLLAIFYFETPPQRETRNVSKKSPVVRIVERSAPRARTTETGKLQQEISDTKASHPELNGGELAQLPQLPHEINGSTPDMSGYRESWFSHYRKGFDGMAKELEGKVTITYPGYEGKFNVQFLIPPKPYERTPVPIFMADDKNPSVNALGGSGLEFSESDDGTVMIRFHGHSIRAFFHKKLSAEVGVSQREEPNQITSVLFTFDPNKKKGTSPVEVRFSFESKGPTTTIGKLDYEVKQTSGAG